MARCPLPAVLLLLLAAGPLLAADSAPRLPLPGESAGTGRRLYAADKLAADKQYAAAAEEYARIIDEAGNDLVAVDAHWVVPARRLCQARLAALPPAFLRPYRSRVDPQAKKWLDEGTAEHDVRPLLRVVDETFGSRPTDAALDLLGDLEFERGRFHEAERWWRMLALPASEVALRLKDPPPPPWSRSGDQPPSLDLLFADPQVDVARARAKQVLALLFRGERDAACAELEAYRALHPKAEGHLAGRKGTYADILQAVASRPIPPEPADDAGWPTFGGSPSRGAVLPPERSDPNRLNRLVVRGPAWHVPLGKIPQGPAKPGLPLAGGVAVPSVAERARHLAFHPVILGRQVLVADARRVLAVNTATGEQQTWDLGRDGHRLPNAARQALTSTLPAPADLRYTLTVADGRVYARLGVQELPPTKPGADADSFLVCLEFVGPEQKLKEVWLRGAGAPAKGPLTMFEGAPVVRDGLLYVAVTRFDGGPMTTEVRCYAADSDAAPRWKQDVVVCRDLPTAPRYRHQLLTLAGRHVVYASHAGAVVALDARTGRRAWAFRYPSTVVMTPGGTPLPRDLAPAVYADGRLYVAPADYDRLLCLDPETGKLLWEREAVEVIHLLGVGSGRLIFTTPKSIRAVRAADGTDDGGWQTPGEASGDGLPSYGRGFLAGDCVFCPTLHGVQVLSQSDGLPPADLIPGPLQVRDPLQVRGHLEPGNLAYGNGILAVAELPLQAKEADEFELAIYLPPRTEAAEPPEQPAQSLDRQARRAADLAAAGRPAEALDAWQRVLADDRRRRGTLRDARHLPQSAAVVAAERIDELLRAHGRALYAPCEEKARALLTSAQDAAALERLAEDYPNALAAGPALLRLAQAHERAGRWGAAAAAYRRLLRRGAAADDRQAARAGLSRAAEQEGRRPAGPAKLSDLDRPLTRSWEKEERLLPLAEGSPGAEVLLVREPSSSDWFSGRSQSGAFANAPLCERPLNREGAGMVVCRDAATGAERWARPVVGSPSWAGRDARIAVVAGAGAVQGFALSDGTPLWQLPAPDAAAFCDPRLSAFHVAAGRFFCLQGECRLLALDVESGRVLWQNWSPAARLPAEVPGARFSPHYLAAGDRVLLQSAGRCRLLDARTGSVVCDRPTERLLWAQPPLPLAEGRVAVVNGRRLIDALDLASGKAVWSHTLSGYSTLSGEPPLLVGAAGALYVAVPRNYGYALRRLDPATGRPLWEDEVSLGPDRVGPTCFAFDAGGVYYTSRNVVTALAVDDGRRLWDEALPGPAGAWSLRRAGAALLAWPAEAPRAKFHSRWLTASLELDMTFPPEDRPGLGVPVLLLDPENGRALQRLNFVPPAARVQGRFATGEELTAVPALLGERAAADGPIVCLTGDGLVVGWATRVAACGLARPQ